MKKILLVFAAFLIVSNLFSQEVKELLAKVKAKYDLVNDYTAAGKMKTNVVFIKAPVATIKVYYKKPDKLKIKNESGVSFVPKGSVNVNMNNVLGLKDFEAVDGGKEKVAGTECRVVKIFPLNDNDNISRATLYIDEKQLLVLRSVISTKENGAYELLMSYKKYVSYGLPDKVELSFNTKDYKLPKGITVDYDNGTGKSEAEKEKDKNKKGKVEITYTGYTINKGVPDSVFTTK
jgi:outer membrane lipoprotein-sorting protein